MCLPIVNYHICTYCYANFSTKDDIHPTSATPSVTVSPMLAPPSPLPWLQHYHRYCPRCHCHCRCQLPLPRLPPSPPPPFLLLLLKLFGWLLSALVLPLLPPPLPAPAVAAVGGCQRHLDNVEVAANCCPLLLPPQSLPLSTRCSPWWCSNITWTK